VTSASSDVDFDDYGVFGYQLEPEYTEEELRQMEEAASAQRWEIENNPRQNDTNLISEKKLTFLNYLLALDNVFSTKSEEQEVNLVWPNLFIIFDCPSSVYTAHVHDLFRTLSK
jgi:hypothetical protein